MILFIFYGLEADLSILVQHIVSSTIEKRHSDSTFIAGTANMAFENLDTQLQRKISINVFLSPVSDQHIIWSLAGTHGNS